MGVTIQTRLARFMMKSSISLRVHALSKSFVLFLLACLSTPVFGQVTADLPVIGIRADPSTTSEPIPGALMIPAKFIVSRTGSTAGALTVRLEYAGSATAGVDYEALPTELVIPAGTNAAAILVRAKTDNLVEGTETVVAKLVAPTGIPENTRPFMVDSAHASAEVRITNYNALPTVSLDATTPETREPSPNVRVAPGVFTVRRTGDTGSPLTVYLSYEGSATASKDYRELPQSIIIPAGAAESQLLVEPIDDDLVEGDESVAVSLPLVPFAFDTGYSVNPEHRAAKVVIHDNDSAPPRTIIRISARDPEATELSPLVDAIDPARFEITRDGPTNNDVLVFFSVHGTAIEGQDYPKFASHSISIPAGERSASLNIVPIGDLLTVVEPMETVGIRIEPSPLAGPLPTYEIDAAQSEAAAVIYERTRPERGAVEIALPSSGESFAVGAPISILAAAYRPNTPIYRLVFYADDKQIGVSEIQTVAIPDGVLFHHFTWKEATPGPHILTARAALSDGTELVSSKVQITVGDGTILPMVSIRYFEPDTKQPIPNADYAPGVLEIRRTGPTNESLLVYFEVGGTATPGIDYEKIDPRNVLIPVGSEVAYVKVAAIDDKLVEGNETVQVTLIQPANTVDPALRVAYTIDPEHKSAAIIIYDNDQSTGTARIEITKPANGEVFRFGMDILINAVAVDPNGYINRLEFRADDKLIGVSEIVFIRAPDPGTPIYHSITWTNPPAGDHVIIASGVDANGNRVLSNPVKVTVANSTLLPVVSIRYIEPQTDQPIPNADYAPGLLEIRRTGPTNESLLIYFNVGGTATPGIDYEKIDPRYILIPAGASAAYLRIKAIDDELVEGKETVQVTLVSQPDAINADFRAAYAIDPEHKSAAVVIYDNDQSSGSARIEITKPANGDVFAPGVHIPINAVAIDPNGYIPRLEFHADDKLIGVSEIVFIRAPDPGTPVYHSIVWTNPPPGDHVLTANGIDAKGNRVVSNPVRISVRNGTTDDQVVLSIAASDPSATEAVANGEADPAVFVIKRIAGRKDVEVTANFTISGTARNGVDYSELRQSAVLPAGAVQAEIFVKPIADNIIEGEETVILTLIPPPCVAIFPPPPECYRVGDPGNARAVIRDSNGGGNIPPKVAIGRPQDGAVFVIGQNIEVRAEAGDADGAIERLDIFADDSLLGSTKLSQLTVVWSNAPAGPHVFKARATDNAGAESESALVRIMVREQDASSFVRRDLPAGFSRGVAFIVALEATPPRGTRAYAVEDLPPKGWPVSQISHDGAFDALTGKIKFGPFTDDQARKLTYQVSPPADAAGRYEFGGSSSANGQAFPIAGDRIIESVTPVHPADQNNDSRIAITETTAYSASWKAGETWMTPPNPIPLTYVTRAAMLWRQGETYHYDASQGPAPLCWVSNAARPEVVALNVSTAVRSITAAPEPGKPFAVDLSVTPAGGVNAYGVEEVIPEGWTVNNISDDGRFITASRTIRWGVFLDATRRTLSYTLTAPPNVTSVAGIRGSASFDGAMIPVLGLAKLIAVESSTLLRVPRVEPAANGSINLQLAGPAGQTCVLEISSDLTAWTELKEVYLPDGQLDYQDADSDGIGQRYYRLRVR